MTVLTFPRAKNFRSEKRIEQKNFQLIEHERKYRNFLRCRIVSLKSNFEPIFRPKSIDRNRKKFHCEISHFRLRQIRWKNQVERENRRLISAILLVFSFSPRKTKTNFLFEVASRKLSKRVFSADRQKQFTETFHTDFNEQISFIEIDRTNNSNL